MATPRGARITVAHPANFGGSLSAPQKMGLGLAQCRACPRVTRCGARSPGTDLSHHRRRGRAALQTPGSPAAQTVSTETV